MDPRQARGPNRRGRRRGPDREPVGGFSFVRRVRVPDRGDGGRGDRPRQPGHQRRPHVGRDREALPGRLTGIDASKGTHFAMDDISYTAQWTAAARALESERANPMFRDDYARHLAEPRGFELLDRYEGAAVADFIAVRTRYMDDAITRTLAETDIRQIVLLANGMDARTYRLDWPDAATVYEIDHGALLAEKQARLAKLGAVPRVPAVPVGVDLAGDWLGALKSAGFDSSRRTLWVAEGLVFFLTEEQVG